MGAPQDLVVSHLASPGLAHQWLRGMPAMLQESEGELVTICFECTHWHRRTYDQPMCAASPLKPLPRVREPIFGSRTQFWVGERGDHVERPFAVCTGINDGDCKLFKPASWWQRLWR